jgi:hypothetical protein
MEKAGGMYIFHQDKEHRSKASQAEQIKTAM